MFVCAFELSEGKSCSARGFAKVKQMLVVIELKLSEQGWMYCGEMTCSSVSDSAD